MLLVAWHDDCEGICERLDFDGHDKYGFSPQAPYWTALRYRRVDCWATDATYELVGRLGSREPSAAPRPIHVCRYLVQGEPSMLGSLAT
jgi:hypothetical protein